MDRIAAPIEPRSTGAHVANLQDALWLFVEHDTLIRDGATQQRVLRALETERERRVFGDAGTGRHGWPGQSAS